MCRCALAWLSAGNKGTAGCEPNTASPDRPDRNEPPAFGGELGEAAAALSDPRRLGGSVRTERACWFQNAEDELAPGGGSRCDTGNSSTSSERCEA